jgi:hypothetical protein
VTLQRLVELAGIPTVIIASLPSIAQQSGAPRILSVDTPMGAALGQPGNSTQQTTILTAALDLLVRLDQPGLIVDAHQTYRTPQT